MMFISAVPVREEAAPRTTTAAGISPARPGLVRPLCQVRRQDKIFPLLCLMARSSVQIMEVLDCGLCVFWVGVLTNLNIFAGFSL